MCAKGEGETCGGIWGEGGACAPGLRCEGIPSGCDPRKGKKYWNVFLQACICSIQCCMICFGECIVIMSRLE